MLAHPDPLRIGGEFELIAADFIGEERFDLPSRGARHEIWLDSGRSALSLVARQLKARGVESVWVPALSCESIAQACLQAGLGVRHYASGLAGPASLPTTQQGDALLFIHYFGHIDHRMLAQIAGWRSRGVWVIEDAVQAGLAQLGSLAADFAITSLRKLLPVPDGALLSSREEITIPIAPPDESFVSARLTAKLVRAVSSDATLFLPLVEACEARLSGRIEARRMSWLSQHLLRRCDLPAIATRRRENWARLSAQLRQRRGLDRVQPLFFALAEGDVPLGLAVRVPDGRRDPLRRFLTERGIYCPVHWPLQSDSWTIEVAADLTLSAEILTLPTDQRMAIGHIDRMVDAVQDFFAR